jgi:hypothetical protein
MDPAYCALVHVGEMRRHTYKYAAHPMQGHAPSSAEIELMPRSTPFDWDALECAKWPVFAVQEMHCPDLSRFYSTYNMRTRLVGAHLHVCGLWDDKTREHDILEEALELLASWVAVPGTYELTLQDAAVKLFSCVMTVREDLSKAELYGALVRLCASCNAK